MLTISNLTQKMLQLIAQPVNINTMTNNPLIYCSIPDATKMFVSTPEREVDLEDKQFQERHVLEFRGV